MAGLIEAKTHMRGQVVQVVATDDTAMLYTNFDGSSLGEDGRSIPIEQKAIEILRRRPDGTWGLIIGDSIGRER